MSAVVPRQVVDIGRSRLAWRDLVSESVTGMLQRPGRSALTALGTVLGIGCLVAILGLTATAGAQISKRFTVLEATQVTVQDLGGLATPGGSLSFPQDASDRVDRLHGVVTSGVYWKVPFTDADISASPTAPPGSGADLDVYAASPGLLQAMQPTLAAGRLYDEFAESHREQVAVLTAAAAHQLGITSLENQPAIFIAGDPYTVVGIISGSTRLPSLLLGVLIPESVALDRYGPPDPAAPANMLIETQLGAAQQVAGEAVPALRPDDPGLLKAVAPPDPRTLKQGVTSDIDNLFLLLASLAIVVGALGIANTTLVAILERTSEIGLRRSLGARPRHIAAQFLSESVVLGVLGGLVGTSLGVLAVLITSIARQWTPVMQPWVLLAAPLAGGAVGFAAGLYPALRAARIEPVQAMRR